MEFTFESLLEKDSSSIPNNSTKIFNLEKSIAELTGSNIVLKEMLHQLKNENMLLTQRIDELTQTVETLKNLPQPAIAEKTDSSTFLPGVKYLSVITSIMPVTEFQYLEKPFGKYLVELTGKPGVYEINRELALSQLTIGTKIQHYVDGNKIKNYQVILS
jgi:hypothetical protein